MITAGNNTMNEAKEGEPLRTERDYPPDVLKACHE